MVLIDLVLGGGNRENMLHIVLFLLKIIGIILASILGLFLFFILIVLLVPVRYRIYAENKEEILAMVKVSWLFRFLYLHVSYSDNRLMIRLRILGKVFYDNNKPGSEKEPGKPRKHIKLKETLKSKGQYERKPPDTLIISSEKQKMETLLKPGRQEKEMEAAENLKKDSHSVKKVKGVFSRIKVFFLKIKEIINKIKDLFRRFKHTIHDLEEKIARFCEIWNKFKAFTQDEINKKAFSKLLYSLKKILKHIYPAKLKADLEFGTGDPCLTGHILGIMAIFYGLYGKSIRIIPNFEEEIFQGTVFCIGRIRLFTLLIICIKLMLNNNFRQLLKNFKAFKEDLK